MPNGALLSHLWQLENGLFRERDFAGLGRMVHGVTARSLGDMKDAGYRSEALSKAGLSRTTPRVLKQVHGTTVVEAKLENEAVLEADGWVSNDPQVALCVYVADCLPIFIWDQKGSAVGIFHAGWRGLAAGMVKSAVRSFRRYDLAPDRLGAAIGPHIGACCYRVGPEVAQRFHSSGEYLDLGEAARSALLEEGLSSRAILVSDDCTACRSDDFFSYRRDKMDKRMMAFIAMPVLA